MNVSSGLPDVNVDHCPACDNPVLIQVLHSPKDIVCPGCGRLLWFVARQAGDVRILTFLPGLLGASESIERLDEVRAILGDASRILVNLGAMQFINSVFLGMLVALHKRLAAVGGSIKVYGLPPDVADVFKITRLDQIFETYADERAALKSLA